MSNYQCSSKLYVKLSVQVKQFFKLVDFFFGSAASMSLHHHRRLLPASAAVRAFARLPVLCVCARRRVLRRPGRATPWRHGLAAAPWRHRLAAAPWRQWLMAARGGGPLAGRHRPTPRPPTCFATGGYGRAESVCDAGGWRVPGLTLRIGMPLGIRIPGVPAVAEFGGPPRACKA